MIKFGSVSGDEAFNLAVGTSEWKRATKLMRQAAGIIQNIPIDIECYPVNFYEAWVKEFRNYLRGSDG